MYMLETIINSHPHYLLCGESQSDALVWASQKLRAWICWSSFKDQCDPEAAKQVMALIGQDQYAQAMDVWNEANTNPTISFHEVEILARNCHHDPDTLAREDEYYVVELALDGVGSVNLLPTNLAALECAAGFLRDWTSHNPLYAYECDEPIRQEVRRLLRKNKIADAIDAWPNGVKNPTIAVHKLRVLRKVCHHDVPGSDPSSQCRDCC